LRAQAAHRLISPCWEEQSFIAHPINDLRQASRHKLGRGSFRRDNGFRGLESNWNIPLVAALRFNPGNNQERSGDG
jgi:hypothetical protein